MYFQPMPIGLKPCPDFRIRISDRRSVPVRISASRIWSSRTYHLQLFIYDHYSVQFSHHLNLGLQLGLAASRPPLLYGYGYDDGHSRFNHQDAQWHKFWEPLVGAFHRHDPDGDVRGCRQ